MHGATIRSSPEPEMTSLRAHLESYNQVRPPTEPGANAALKPPLANYES
jgi:hypothetical protein